jgi:hypothetical protein
MYCNTHVRFWPEGRCLDCDALAVEQKQRALRETLERAETQRQVAVPEVDPYEERLNPWWPATDADCGPAVQAAIDAAGHATFPVGDWKFTWSEPVRSTDLRSYVQTGTIKASDSRELHVRFDNVQADTCYHVWADFTVVQNYAVSWGLDRQATGFTIHLSEPVKGDVRWTFKRWTEGNEPAPLMPMNPEPEPLRLADFMPVDYEPHRHYGCRLYGYPLDVLTRPDSAEFMNEPLCTEWHALLLERSGRGRWVGRAEVERVAKQNGISLRDAAGVLAGKAWQELVGEAEPVKPGSNDHLRELMNRAAFGTPWTALKAECYADRDEHSMVWRDERDGRMLWQDLPGRAWRHSVHGGYAERVVKAAFAYALACAGLEEP